MTPGTRDTGIDEEDTTDDEDRTNKAPREPLLHRAPRKQRPKSVELTFAFMRRKDVRNNYILMMDRLIQAVVTYKRYKMNRTTKPFSEWVTVSDEAFLIVCLENYARAWQYERLLENVGDPPEGDAIPVPKFTGKEMGTRKSWSVAGIKTFNVAMMRVYHDRQKRGKEFDDEFMQAMKDMYEKKPRDKKKIGASGSRQEKNKVILSDFNIKEYMEQYGHQLDDRSEREEPSNSDSDEGSIREV